MLGIKQAKFRFIDSTTATVANQLAVDKNLLQDFDNQAVFRLYDWFDGCSIGMSQDPSRLPELQGLNLQGDEIAKRMTGGGILFHGHDISYTIIVPSLWLRDLSVKASYEYLCSFLKQFYKNLGLNPNFAKDCTEINLSKSNFCQVGFEAYDMIINGQKIGGNAQKRSKQAIFQHGSIPLFTHKRFASRYSGASLADFNIDISMQEAKQKLTQAFVETFGVIKIS